MPGYQVNHLKMLLACNFLGYEENAAHGIQSTKK
jgi:hypothetical protein